MDVFDKDTSHQYQTRNTTHPSPYVPTSLPPSFPGYRSSHSVTNSLKRAMLRAAFQAQTREHATDRQIDSAAFRELTRQTNTTPNRVVRCVRSREGRYHSYRVDAPMDVQYHSSGLPIPQVHAEDAPVEQDLTDVSQALQAIPTSPSHAPLNFIVGSNGNISPP